MRVLVAGGGIGGLALAQGLRRAGIDVLVVERDVDLAATGGYRLHLAAPALRALRDLLPPALLERLHAVSAADHRGISVRDHHGRLLVRTPPPADEAGVPSQALDVDRITLRRLLADGLGEALRLGSTVEGFTAQSDSVSTRVRLTGSGGRSTSADVECDVLIAADGARSLLTAQLAGGATAAPTGFIGIAGWSPADSLDAPTQELLASSSVLAVGPGGAGLYASWHDPARDSPLHPRHHPCADVTPKQVLSTDAATPPARVIWGLIAVEDAVRTPSRVGLSDLPPEQLLDAAAMALRRRGWTPLQRSIVERADPATVGAFSFWAADPNRIAPWSTSRITALGDAVHAVPPTGGRGAATAIEDAGDLCAALQRVATGDQTTVMALHDYEQRLRARGADAVRESLQPLAWIRGTATPLGASVARVALPLAAIVAAGARRIPRR